MGINILDENEIIVSKIDMDIKDNPFYIVCNIEKVLKYKNKKIGNFFTLLKNKEKIRQGYESLKYINNKPKLMFLNFEKIKY